jgi:hypothetical protein
VTVLGQRQCIRHRHIIKRALALESDPSDIDNGSDHIGPDNPNDQQPQDQDDPHTDHYHMDNNGPQWDFNNTDERSSMSSNEINDSESQDQDDSEPSENNDMTKTWSQMRSQMKI